MFSEIKLCLLFAHSVLIKQFLIRTIVATLRYLGDEAIDSNHAFNPNDWSMISMGRSSPQQHNHCDCGMFVAMYVDFLMSDLKLNFCQLDMKYFRMRLSVDIIHGYLSSNTFCKNDSNILHSLLLDNSPSQHSFT
jgi:Ulp1 family protease